MVSTNAWRTSVQWLEYHDFSQNIHLSNLGRSPFTPNRFICAPELATLIRVDAASVWKVTADIQHETPQELNGYIYFLSN